MCHWFWSTTISARVAEHAKEHRWPRTIFGGFRSASVTLGTPGWSHRVQNDAIAYKKSRLIGLSLTSWHYVFATSLWFVMASIGFVLLIGGAATTRYLAVGYFITISGIKTQQVHAWVWWTSMLTSRLLFFFVIALVLSSMCRFLLGIINSPHPDKFELNDIKLPPMANAIIAFGFMIVIACALMRHPSLRPPRSWFFP